ncbi:hypothetical protein [Spirosoma sp.]|uniref:hypothetical protein n=1 Tax=Spirosoma sp. TaxID=1899569 RepID=UPI0026129DFF|nr:hypothetical protein [Spirosoma sp.]MCX6216471.1 hypothetical protein [Spirosoma sp.]
MIKVQELIVTDLSKRGSGKEALSPVRTILEVYTKEGKMLASNDPRGNYSVEDMVAFSKACLAEPEKSVEEIFEKWMR